MLAQVGGTCFYDDSVSETATDVVTGPALLFNILGFNTNGAVVYIQFFDAVAADVTVGTTAPKFVIPLPSGGGYSDVYVCPEAFRNGISIAVTSTATGAGAPAAPALVKLTYVGG